MPMMERPAGFNALMPALLRAVNGTAVPAPSGGTP